jgi:hypothetical protein
VEGHNRHSEPDVQLDSHFVSVSTGCMYIYIYIVTGVIVSANQEPRVACIHCSSYAKGEEGFCLCAQLLRVVYVILALEKMREK